MKTLAILAVLLLENCGPDYVSSFGQSVFLLDGASVTENMINEANAEFASCVGDEKGVRQALRGQILEVFGKPLEYNGKTYAGLTYGFYWIQLFALDTLVGSAYKHELVHAYIDRKTGDLDYSHASPLFACE